MKFNTCTGITWSLLELTGLLEDEDSRVYFERTKKHLGLHPFHLTNLHAALNEILSSGLNTYDPELRGFLIAYKNPKLLTPLGEILYDTCFIHVDIEVDFYIFRPEVQCSLKGIVNKKGLSHIGLLVHKAFNVSVPKSEDTNNWPGDKVEIGQELRCTVTHLDCTSRLPYIRGHLDEENYLLGCKVFNKEENGSLENGTDTSEPHRNSSLNNSLNISRQANHINFDSDSESDNTDSTVEPEQSKPSKKNKSQIKPIKEDEDVKKAEKKQPKKSKEVLKRESKITVRKLAKSSHSISDNSEDDDDDVSKNEITFREPSPKIKKEKKKAAKKTLEKSISDTERINGECNIKSEGIHVSNNLETESDELLDEKPNVKKRTKKSKVKADESPEENVARDIEKPTKKSGKKSKASNFPDDFSNIQVKSEKVSTTDVPDPNTTTENVQEEKKQKKKSIKASKKSASSDSEGVSTYQTVQIKTEIGLETSKIKVEKPSNDNANTRLSDDAENADNPEKTQSESSITNAKKGNKTNTEKKTARKAKSTTDSKFDCGSPFKIKSESSTSCDSSSELGKQKVSKKKSVKDRHSSDLDEQAETRSEKSSKKQSKKSKEVEVKIEPEIKVEEEKSVANKNESDATAANKIKRKRANWSSSDSDDSEVPTSKKKSKKSHVFKEEPNFPSVEVKVEDAEPCK